MIGAEGKTSQAPFSQGAFYIGATQELGIVSDKGEVSDGGPMRGYDASGKEKMARFWPVQGRPGR